MREKIARAPRWAVQVFSGALWAAWMTVGGVVQGDSLVSSAVTATIGGVLFGLVGGYFFHRINQQALTAAGGRVPSRAVRRATWRGPAPTSPVDRQQALALVEIQLRQLRWTRPLGLGLAGLLAVGFVVTVVFSRPPSWAALGGTLMFLAIAEAPYRVARRRRATLTGSADVGGEH